MYSFSDKPNNETGLPTGAYFLDYHNVQDPEDEGVILVSMGYCEYQLLRYDPRMLFIR